MQSLDHDSLTTISNKETLLFLSGDCESRLYGHVYASYDRSCVQEDCK